MVGLKAGCYFYEVGGGDFLFSFFSTVSVNLENRKWGSRFPFLMRGLYSGQMKPEYVKPILAEVEQIQQELKAFPPSKVVWDAGDLSKRPPWGDDISEDITDLSNYFVTSEGEDFLEVLKEALQQAAEEKEIVEIISM